MQCNVCFANNRQGAVFCGTCGAMLKGQATPSIPGGQVCQACGSVIPSDFRFCDTCGQPLSADVQRPRAGSAELPPVKPVVEGRKLAASGVLPESFGNGRYRVMGLLGEGAKKLVYLAQDVSLDRQVALAVVKSSLSGNDLIRLRREAKAMAQLSDHPNIVPVYDTGEERGHPYIVSQYMRGGDVESLMKRAPGGRLPASQAVQVCMQVASALDAAHRRGIIHRDVKPSNVWLTEEGVAKLGDFGLAIVQDESRITRMGIMIGTATYMSPECAAGGARAADARSDIYSLGSMLFEMIAGRPPFVGDMVQVIYQQRHSPPPKVTEFVAGIDPRLAHLIDRMLAKDPNARPQSAQQVIGELRMFLS
jgi:serine/threonine protein kinase/predicted nucleic acid-binding Zn ribbon protein